MIKRTFIIFLELAAIILAFKGYSQTSINYIGIFMFGLINYIDGMKEGEKH